MHHTRIILLSVVISSIILNAVVFGDRVNIISQYSSDKIVLKCDAYSEGASRFMIHLSCPFVGNSYCYSNCHSQCPKNLSVCTDIVSSCKYDKIDYGHASITFVINTKLVSKTGEWRCNFKNVQSVPVTLTKYEPKPSTETTASTTFTDVTSNDASSSTDIVSKVSTVPEIKPHSTISLIVTSPSPNILEYMTRPELVLVLVILLGFSLLLNLSFLIRCVLLKSVVDNYHRGIRTSPCILSCLCLDSIPSNYFGKGYSRSLNLSNQVGSNFYGCQAMSPDNIAIYDDLSAVSNGSARLKLRSTYSSDLDEEARLTTNLMPNGGCHVNPIAVGSVSTSLPRRYTSPTHAAYYHPGLGNYVIVSGPVSSSDQYTIGTVPPAYQLQMVSPIPSAPGSIGAPGTQPSVPSAHSDELPDSDNDSRTVNSVTSEAKESGKPREVGQHILLPINQVRHPHVGNLNNMVRPNGSVPLHPWPNDVPPYLPTASVSSLPQYPLSENMLYLQESQLKEQVPLLNVQSTSPVSEKY